MARIFAPNKKYTGLSGSVSFVNGVGETSNPYLIDWFRRHGYAIEEPEPQPKGKANKKSGE